MAEDRIIRNDMLAVGILALVVFLLASVATYTPADRSWDAPSILTSVYQPDQLVWPVNAQFENACGRLGAWTADMLIHVLGVGVYFLIVGLIAVEIALFRHSPVESPWLKSLGWTIALFGFTALGSMMLPDWTVSPLIGAGGYLGALGHGLMKHNVGHVGAMIGGIFMLTVGMMMWTEYLIFRAGRLAFAPAAVAATRLLPFGLVHQFLQWFNGEVDEYEEEDEDEEFEEEGDALDARVAAALGESEDSGHTIRFRRRDNGEDVFDEVQINSSGLAAAASMAAPGTAVLEPGEIDDIEDEEFEEDDDAIDDADSLSADDAEEEEEADEEAFADEVEDASAQIASLSIRDNTSKAVVPALEPAGDADGVTEAPGEVTRTDQGAAALRKPHFRVKGNAGDSAKPPSERDAMMETLDKAALVDSVVDYQLPPLEMLEQGDTLPFEQQKREALIKAEILEKTCKQFGFVVKVVEIETGPVISQYEIDLEPGLRLQKIVALADDLAIAMRVPSVRIVAPIPGKNSVGVEVPNETRQVVRLRGVMEQCDAQIKKMKIPLFLGADAVGAPMVADLASLPHLLIAGRTGTGKSVCLNAIITSMLMTRRPDEVRMLMIDPKMVELSGYARLPHLMHPVVTDMRKAEAILAWAVEKMEERYQLLARAGVRHVTTFNQLGEEEIMERLDPTDEERDSIPTNLPFIVIVADEMADLMMTAGKDVETHIIRLAQKSRAVGIHLILATQKPTVDVITGLIKSNLPARIAFQVASKTDSRVVLDAQGADKLLGCGDMLFLWPGTSTLLRGQGTYLSDNEIDSITDAVSTGEQNFVNELINIKVKSEDEETGSSADSGDRKEDELYIDAIEIVVREQRGSLSLLQRALGIGYGRAARLVDYMEEDGYVGVYNGSKSREVLLTPEMWENIQRGDPNPVNDEDWPEEDVENAAADAVPPPKRKPTSKPAPDSTVTPSPRKKLKAIENPNRMTNLALNQSPAIEPPVSNADDAIERVDARHHEALDDEEDDENEELEDDLEEDLDEEFDESDYEVEDESDDEDELEDEDYDPEDYEDVE